MSVQDVMIRPEISEDLVTEVKMLSKNVNGSFEDSLRIVVDEFKKLKKQKEKSVNHE